MRRLLMLCIGVAIVISTESAVRAQCGPYVNFVPPGYTVVICPAGDAAPPYPAFGIFVFGCSERSGPQRAPLRLLGN